MRIGIDIRHLARGPYAGVAVVTRELVEALARNAPEDTFRIFYAGLSAPPALVRGWAERFANVAVTHPYGSNRLFDLRAKLLRAPKLDRSVGDADVWLSPHTMLAPLARAPRALIIHDLSFVAEPLWYSPQSRRWHWFVGVRKQAEDAAAIIVPSEATKFDLWRFWKIPAAKVSVIPWAVRHEQPPITGQRPTTEHRQILFVGTVEKRKNVLGLLRAFEILKRDVAFHDVRLVIAGVKGWGSDEVVNAVNVSKAAEDIAMRGYVSEEEKAKLLAEASVFVYPSFYEGFGLPVLEAMAAGVPVVTAKTTSLPEVAGDAALLVDPTRPEEIAQGLREVLTDEELSRELSQRGQDRARHFTWQRTAQQILAVLREVKVATPHCSSRISPRSAIRIPKRLEMRMSG